MNADMVFNQARNTIAIVDFRTLTSIKSNGEARESEFEVGISQPVPFGNGLLVKAGDGSAVIEGDVLRPQKSVFLQNRVLQVASAGVNAVLVTAHAFNDNQCVEIRRRGPQGDRCQYARLPEGVWRIRPFGNSAALWDVDRGKVLLADCDGFRALQWDASTMDGMVWATPGKSGLVLADKNGYTILTFN